MAAKLDQRLVKCKSCAKTTMHYRETKEMNWIMHLVLVIFTAGIWFPIWMIILIFHVLTKPIGGQWICSCCGKVR